MTDARAATCPVAELDAGARAALRRPRRRAAAFADALPHQRALHDRARRLRPHRHAASAASTSSPGCTCEDRLRRRTTSSSRPRATTRPALYAVLIGARACSTFELHPQLRRLDGLPGPSATSARRGIVSQHRLARHGHLQGEGHGARRPAGGPAGASSCSPATASCRRGSSGSRSVSAAQLTASARSP